MKLNYTEQKQHERNCSIYSIYLDVIWLYIQADPF